MICNLTGATEVNYPDVKAEKNMKELFDVAIPAL